MKFIGVQFLSYEDQLVADATKLDTFYDRKPLNFSYDDGQSVVGRVNSCTRLDIFKERLLLVKQPLGSGKSFQARRLKYKRVCWLTSTRALADETSQITGFVNYQNVPYSTPLSLIDNIIVLAPSMYRMRCEFIEYDCLVIDEAESFFEDIFSGLYKGPNFECGMDVFRLLMKTSKKILFLDGFLKTARLVLPQALLKTLVISGWLLQIILSTEEHCGSYLQLLDGPRRIASFQITPGASRV